MSIANRLEKFIETEKLSKSAFAQKIGIQRSTLAHFFSGRNKPSSDFFLKIKESYPELDLNWLISGNKRNKSKKYQTIKKKIKSVIILYDDGSYKEN
jgi:plasmid maintenance system antidote protein VapI